MKISIDKSYYSILTHTGVPNLVLLRKELDLDSSVTYIEATTGKNKKPTSLKRSDQIRMFKKMIKHPIGKPALFCISSNPTDTEAKYAAAYLLSQAIEKYQQFQKNGEMSTAAFPRWHILNGTYQDWYREHKRNVSFLVLSNVLHDSSEAKIEKLRDLIEIYADIPKVIVTATQDPITFCTEKLHVRLTGAMYLRTIISRKNAKEI